MHQNKYKKAANNIDLQPFSVSFFIKAMRYSSENNVSCRI
ncbi:hypothetical protein HMPREF3226_02474 [Prevotella corporis]|uniref:Uncharacterized protein n=1 Tax=Prevotella corporis TaxID=28128 RepID=A0A133PVL5_9BACT|nr:hypothetical protein HMPREF3226_02474 [Prevotella corporis]